MSQLKESQHLKIPFKEIEIATKNFEVRIGKGGFGLVYKGELFISGKSTTVAVKRLNEHLGQGLKEFLTEIQLLIGQKHPNLISLLGYCDEGKEKIIVYEYAERGSLDRYLRRRNTIYTLTWLERLKICVEAARGLDYLHNHVGEHQTVIHRDIKSANILIDQNWVAKISDLGLSKLSLAGLNRSFVISHACGTPGYCEPEYIITGIVKKESDVYSFGMVLFEVLCGRLCTVIDDDGFLLSGPLAKDYYEKNKLDEIVDPSLKEQMNLDSTDKFSAIAYECLHDDRGQRPLMDLVVKELEESLEIQLSSYASEAPRKIRGEMGAHVSKKSAVASSGPPAMSLKENHHISTELNSYEAACRSDVELQSFDKTLQAQADNVINTLDVGVEVRAMSAKLGTNQVVRMILDIKKEIWKNQEEFELMEEYFENIPQMLDFCAALEKCLTRLRRTRLLILDGVEENSYEKTLKILKNFKAAGDPFTEDFFKIFHFVYRQQIVLLGKLQTKKVKLNKKVKHIQTWMGKWMNSLLKNNENAIKGQREVISSMQVGNFVAIKDLDGIQVLVDRLQMNIADLMKNAEYFMENAEYFMEGDEMLKLVIKKIKAELYSFMNSVEVLGMHADKCSSNILRSRIVVLQRIAKPPNNH